MRARMWAAAVSAAALTAAMFTPSAAAASGTPPNGTARVTITTPAGVPANITLTGKTQHVVAKPPAGTATTVNLTMPTGLYRVDLPRITFGGTAYTAHLLIPFTVVLPGKTTPLKVSYTAEPGAHDLHATAISQSSVTLTWAAPKGAKFALRRTVGTKPATHVFDGVDVPVTGTTVTDTKLKPGTQYSYALFTQVKNCWYGPITVNAGTAPAAGSDQAAYIAAPSTLLAQPANIASATTTGNGVHVVLQNEVPAPLLGAGVVLPVSAGLPGGFLGVVTALSGDGHTIDLRAGGLSDAFDYYEIAIDDFTASTPPPPAAPAAIAKSQRGGVTAKIAAAQAGCGGSASEKVSYSAGVSVAGHFKTKVDKYSILGADIPVGASIDLAVAATVSGAAAIETTASLKCSVSIGEVFKMLTVSPVPIAVSLKPGAEFGIEGARTVSNLGLTATAGVQVAGSLSVKNGVSFSGNPIASATPLTPQITKNGSVTMKVGAELLLGPGIGTKDAAVIAGLDGQLNPLEASLTPYFPVGDARYNACATIEAKATIGLDMSSKAWIGNWDVSKTIVLDALHGTHQYGGSPWYVPGGCKDLAPPSSPDTLLGSGVTKVDETIIGGAGQWGHVDGFAPGQKTWVLSTGSINDVIGTPDKFASTSLGTPGDDLLSGLSGRPTYDAATYQVKVVPTGTTLHVRYVFASEEYPEFVGSAYNDVMAVWVNGTNCATVPGTNDPVSVNTVNDKTNSTYYVDNSTGAAGYSTSMDGLTTPLTCSVPVTPGQPVTVRISVADSSDGVLDSAVALVDGGIWTD
ncbi:choice-of-anchor L domain-containing protein [Amycolatopsis sp. NPDC098790]|uniref:choice-of-anchor L domain-containing protein n=1 Tax=Amycolatopsis sp. NPDC098790 TaxID=3363939 RepID=UPI00381874C8